MRERLKRLLAGKGGHDVFRNMMVLALGTGAARVVGLASIPIITRVYSPEDFGLLSVFNALLAILIPFATLRYVIALPLPRSDRVAMNLLVLCCTLVLICSAILGVTLWLAGDRFLGVFSAEKLAPYWGLAIVGLAGASLYEILDNWATRKKAFKAVARTQVTQSIAGASVKIGLGLLGWQPVGLLIGQIVQQTGGIVYLARSFWGQFRRDIGAVRLRRLVTLFRRYVEFPIYRLPSQVLLAFSIQAPVLYVSASYDVSVAGQFGLAVTALSLPVTLFSRTTGQAYYGEVARIGKTDPVRIHGITVDTARQMLLLAVGPTLVLAVLGPWLFSIVFGAEWELAGHFARYLSIYLMMLFVCQPLVQILTVYEKNLEFLMLNVIRSVLLVVYFAVAYVTALDEHTFVIFYSITLSAYYIYIFYRIFNLTKGKARERAA